MKARDHIHITFITVYYYNCSTLLLVIVVVNVLLCLTYKLNFIVRYISIGKNIVYIGFHIVRGFRQPPGSLEFPTGKGGLL